MTTHQQSRLQHKHSAIADLGALLCGGGLVVETLGGFRSVAVRSTIQLDGDLTVTIARRTFGQQTIMDSHFAELEARVQRIAQFVERTVWIVHGAMGAVVSVAWLYTLSNSLTLEGPLTTV